MNPAGIPSKHGVFTQSRFNVGPASQTVAQHWQDIVWARVFVELERPAPVLFHIRTRRPYESWGFDLINLSRIGLKQTKWIIVNQA